MTMRKKWRFSAKVRYESLQELVVAFRLDIARVGRVVGLSENMAPSLAQYKEHGRFQPYFLIRRVLGDGEGYSWVDTVKELGFKARKRDLKSDHDDVAMELDRLGKVEFPLHPGHGPSLEFFRQHARITTSVAFRVVGTRRWTKVISHFGRKPAEEVRSARTEGELVKDVLRVADLLQTKGYMPTPKQYNKHGRWAHVTLINRLSPSGDRTWAAVAELCSLKPRRRRNRSLELSTNGQENSHVPGEQGSLGPGSTGAEGPYQ